MHTAQKDTLSVLIANTKGNLAPAVLCHTGKAANDAETSSQLQLALTGALFAYALPVYKICRFGLQCKSRIISASLVPIADAQQTGSKCSLCALCM